MQDLNGEYIVMSIEGVSKEMDAFRNHIRSVYPTVQIVDSRYYGVDTFTMCEVNQYVLITHPIYADIHTNLITIPLKTKYTLPYGLIYANEPTTATRRFIEIVRSIQEEKNFNL